MYSVYPISIINLKRGSTQKWKSMSKYSFFCTFSCKISLSLKMFKLFRQHFWPYITHPMCSTSPSDMQYFTIQCAVCPTKITKLYSNIFGRPEMQYFDIRRQYLRNYKGISSLDVKILHFGCAGSGDAAGRVTSIFEKKENMLVIVKTIAWLVKCFHF